MQPAIGFNNVQHQRAIYGQQNVQLYARLSLAICGLARHDIWCIYSLYIAGKETTPTATSTCSHSVSVSLYLCLCQQFGLALSEASLSLANARHIGQISNCNSNSRRLCRKLRELCRIIYKTREQRTKQLQSVVWPKSTTMQTHEHTQIGACFYSYMIN